MLPHVGSPAEVLRGMHRRGGGSGLPVREDFLTIRTYSQISVESSPSPEVFKQSVQPRDARLDASCQSC